MRFYLVILLPLVISASSLYGQTVTDAEGNVYPTTTIGSQVWMAANLRTTVFSNGDTIPTTDSCYQVITSEFEPIYQWAYDCDTSFIPVYGLLYTWYVANDPRNVCPNNWHVPSLAEFDTLVQYLGGDSIAGGKLKDTLYWQAPNTGATNEVGYNGVPNAHRSLNGSFWGFPMVSDVWTTTTGTLGARDFDLNHDSEGTVSYDDNKEFGFAIRCLRDSLSGILESNQSFDFKTYPNPANYELNISFDKMIEINEIEITNELGQHVMTINPSSVSISINTIDLAEGLYFLTAYSSDKGQVTERFVILR